MMLYAQLRDLGIRSRAVMTIHDALWVEAPEAEESQVRHLLRKMMTTVGKLRVPMVVDIK